jgi:hypothetical protein
MSSWVLSSIHIQRSHQWPEIGREVTSTVKYELLHILLIWYRSMKTTRGFPVFSNYKIFVLYLTLTTYHFFTI